MSRKINEKLKIRWEERNDYYPWVTTLIAISICSSSILIGIIVALTTGSIESSMNKAIEFSFLNPLSLIFWLPGAFLIGFLKNKNLNWKEEFEGGTLFQAFFYGIGLYIGVAIIYLFIFIGITMSSLFFPITINFDDIFPENQILPPITLLGICSLSMFGSLISIMKRGSLFEPFVSIE